MSEKLDADLATELSVIADAAEQDAIDNPEAAFPPGAVVTQPNRTRTLTLRLRQSEYDAVAAAAERKHLPISALARSVLLEKLGA